MATMNRKKPRRSEVSAALKRIFSSLKQETPWFVSPVSVPCEPCAERDLPERPSTSCEHHHQLDNACAPKAAGDVDTLPVFKEHDEPSSIQLFYDLFFVANLSACTNNHPIEEKASLGSYVGFFTLLWFTWFNTIIFDVRFAIDSWFIRLSKACSFGIMTAFAMSSVFFDTADRAQFGHDAPMMSLILMTSRFVLVIQYGVIMVAAYQRHRKGSVIVPFALTMCTSLVAAFVYLGLYRFFNSESIEKHSYGYFGWYITSVLEAGVLLVISYKSDLMKFDTTNIVERMGALTLIIMGEGIIAMTESVSFILKTESRISSSTVGLVIAAVLVIYVLWMLYFDHADELDHPGGRINKQKPWCQLWAFLHYPMHIAILLTLKGSARFVLWWNANGTLNFLFDNFSNYWNPENNGTQLFQKLQNQLTNISNMSAALSIEIQNNDFQAKLKDLQKLGLFNGSSDDDFKALDILFSMEDALLSKTCEAFEIKSDFTIPLGLDFVQADELLGKKLDKIFEAFRDWYTAFFIAAGCVLIILALARYVGHQDPIFRSGAPIAPGVSAHKRRVPWVAITFQCLVGIGLTMISLMGKWEMSNPFMNFIKSQWIIPTVLIAFCLVIVCDNFLYYWSTDTLCSDILHPPTTEGSPSAQKMKKYHGEIKRLRTMLVEHGTDPMAGCLLEDVKGRSSALDRQDGFGKDSKSPFLDSSANGRELDRMSTRTDYSSVTEVPLLRSSLAPGERDSDALSARTGYSRFEEEQEEGYGV